MNARDHDCPRRARSRPFGSVRGSRSDRARRRRARARGVTHPGRRARLRRLRRPDPRQAAPADPRRVRRRRRSRAPAHLLLAGAAARTTTCATDVARAGRPLATSRSPAISKTTTRTSPCIARRATSSSTCAGRPRGRCQARGCARSPPASRRSRSISRTWRTCRRSIRGRTEATPRPALVSAAPLPVTAIDILDEDHSLRLAMRRLVTPTSPSRRSAWRRDRYWRRPSRVEWSIRPRTRVGARRARSRPSSQEACGRRRTAPCAGLGRARRSDGCARVLPPSGPVFMR